MIAFATLRIPLKTVFFLLLGLSGFRSVQASNPKDLSIDLRSYGYQQWRESSGLRNSSELGLAATNNLVAVGLGNPCNKTHTDERDDHTNWEISLLVFDPTTGKMKSKGGPWTGDRPFELFSTSRGNFLLLLRHFNGTSGEIGETVFLLSPLGNELKKLFLAPSIVKSKQTWNTFLVSPGGSTALIGQVLEDGVHYKVLDTDTLEMKFEWMARAGTNAPRVLALSDQGLLGLAASKTPHVTSAPEGDTKLYLGKFDGAWTPFPASLEVSHTGYGRFWISNQLAFLSDDTIVGLRKTQDGAAASLAVLRTDGTTVLSPAIPQLGAHTSLTGPVNVSQDGRYFVVGCTHRPWLSHLMLDVWQMDDTFQNDELELLVWASSQPKPVARFNLGSDVAVSALHLALDDPPSIVFLSRSTLRVIRIHPLP